MTKQARFKCGGRGGMTRSEGRSYRITRRGKRAGRILGMTYDGIVIHEPALLPVSATREKIRLAVETVLERESEQASV